jgi:hypothetical protein
LNIGFITGKASINDNRLDESIQRRMGVMLLLAHAEGNERLSPQMGPLLAVIRTQKAL